MTSLHHNYTASCPPTHPPIYSPLRSYKTLNRLKFLQNHQDGLAISKYDLKTRGPGEVFSTLQHGFPSLKLTTLSDTKIIKIGQSILQDIIKNHPDFDLNRLIKPASDIISP